MQNLGASMYAKNEKLFLVLTAFVEAGAGICLLFLPNILFSMLLGVAHPTKEAIFVGRLMGAALIAIGVASWIARADARTPAQLGLLTGIFIYNVGASTL